MLSNAATGWTTGTLPPDGSGAPMLNRVWAAGPSSLPGDGPGRPPEPIVPAGEGAADSEGDSVFCTDGPGVLVGATALAGDGRGVGALVADGGFGVGLPGPGVGEALAVGLAVGDTVGTDVGVGLGVGGDVGVGAGVGVTAGSLTTTIGGTPSSDPVPLQPSSR